MRMAGVYSFKGGRVAVASVYPDLLTEVNRAIRAVDAPAHRTKPGREQTMPGRIVSNPRSLNPAFKAAFSVNGWSPIRVACPYATTDYLEDSAARSSNRGAFREMDSVKDKLGVEVRFGESAFMVYNVCAKMTIFHNLGHIDHGIEIVPVKAFADEMSTGDSYFEQFVWDLEGRGTADIDIPVMVIGIDV